MKLANLLQPLFINSREPESIPSESETGLFYPRYMLNTDLISMGLNLFFLIKKSPMYQLIVTALIVQVVLMYQVVQLVLNQVQVMVLLVHM